MLVPQRKACSPLQDGDWNGWEAYGVPESCKFHLALAPEIATVTYPRAWANLTGPGSPGTHSRKTVIPLMHTRYLSVRVTRSPPVFARAVALALDALPPIQQALLFSSE